MAGRRLSGEGRGEGHVMTTMYPVERIPPQNIDAEMAVLGAMLLGERAADDVIETLRREDFYRDAHGHIFDAIGDLRKKSEPVDMVTLRNELSAKGILENVGGLAYLMHLADFVPTTANCLYHAGIVAEKATFRRLIEASSQIAGMAYGEVDELDAVIALSERTLLEATEKRDAVTGVTIGDYALTYMDELYERYEAGGGLPGIPTGFTGIDHLTNGLVPSDLIVLGARPSMGKTAWGCVTLPLHIAEQGKRVNVYSLEMAKKGIFPRFLSNIAKVPLKPIFRAELSDDELRRLQEATDYFRRLPINLVDKSDMTVAQIRAHVRRTKPDFIVVDYLELIESERGRKEERRFEIDRIAKGLKKIAKDFNIPVMVLSQLNRGVESRQDKRPMLSDLKESGGIEAVADMVLFLYRADYYDTERKEKFEVEELEVIIAKQRNGQTGRVVLGIRLEYSEVVNDTMGF